MKITGINTKTWHRAFWDIKPDTRMFNRQEYEALVRGETVMQGETVFYRTNVLAQAVHEIRSAARPILAHDFFWVMVGFGVLGLLIKLIF
jgi:hypothetical protein